LILLTVLSSVHSVCTLRGDMIYMPVAWVRVRIRVRVQVQIRIRIRIRIRLRLRVRLRVRVRVGLGEASLLSTFSDPVVMKSVNTLKVLWCNHR
jgi:hypothetical protein